MTAQPHHDDDPDRGWVDVAHLFPDEHESQAYAPTPDLDVVIPLRPQGTNGGVSVPRVTRERTHPIRLGVGAALLSIGAAASTVAGFVALGLFLPWLSPGPAGPADATAEPPPAAVPQVLAAAGPTPAERVVGEVAGTDSAFFAGWAETTSGTGIGSPSLGFGCDPALGTAPTAAASRSWTRGSTAVAISVHAYPAGAGQVALGAIAAAADDCEDAWIVGGSDLGVAGYVVSSDRLSMVAWRRGDVLLLATAHDGLAAVPMAGYLPALEAYDTALADALDGVCARVDAGAGAAVRNPHLAGDDYTTLRVPVPVTRPASHRRRAEERASVPAVPIPAPTLHQPTAGERPDAPDPLPTSGPQALPAVVAPAGAPTPPTRPAQRAIVRREVRDRIGPGCGWVFTGQTAPRFSPVAATRRFEAAVARTEQRLQRRWNRWQDARLAYYTDYAAYTDQARSYRRYVHRLARVRSRWQVIETARADFAAAHVAWQDAVADAERWREQRERARAEYRAAVAACREAPQEPAQDGPVASPTPTTQPQPTADDCPPERPDILDEEPPRLPSEPTPAAEAQLPKASRP